jgi:hypothetical protein
VETGGGANHGLLAIGADDQRRGEAAAIGQSDGAGGKFGSPDVTGFELGQGACRGMKPFHEADIGEVPAEGRHAGLGGVEQRFGRADQPAGGVDDADLRQGVTKPRGIVD